MDNLSQYNLPPATSGPPINPAKAVRLGMGVLLIFFGVGVALWIIWNIYLVLTTPTMIPLLETLRLTETIENIITTPRGDTLISPNMLMLAGYLIVIFFLNICYQLTRAILSGGLSLLQFDK